MNLKFLRISLYPPSLAAMAMAIQAAALLAAGCESGERLASSDDLELDEGDLDADGGTDDGTTPLALRLGQFNLRELTTAKLLDPHSPQVAAAAAIIARHAPDILSINEIQADIAGVPDVGLPGMPADAAAPGQFILGGNAERLAARIAAVPGGPVYDHVLLTMGNSGFAYEGTTDHEELAYRGFGEWPGRFNHALLSRYPIVTEGVRVISDFSWHDLPGHSLEDLEDATGIEVPADYPLFEKALIIVPVNVMGTTIHFILFHPVSSGFNDLNPYRNFDELRAIKLLLDGELPGVDALPDDALFVVVGDLNADPEDGAGREGAVAQIFEHPRVIEHFPVGEGGTAGVNPERNSFLSGCGRGTTDVVYSPDTRLQLQLDYMLVSKTMGAPTDSGLNWPNHHSNYDAYAEACIASDHRFMWEDVIVHVPSSPQEGDGDADTGDGGDAGDAGNGAAPMDCVFPLPC